MDLGVMAGWEGTIGLPPGAAVIRNSQRTGPSCLQRWLLREGDGLIPDQASRALSFGTAFHLIMQEIHSFWMKTEWNSGTIWAISTRICPVCDGRYDRMAQCPSCGGTGRSAVERILDSGWSLEDTTDLVQVAKGWLDFYGGKPDDGLRVVAVEARMGMPVRSPDGKILRTLVPIVVDKFGAWRRARRGELARPPTGLTAHLRRMPVYLVGTIDVVWHDRIGSGLYIGEHKTSGNPGQYMSTLSADTQVPTYELLLSDVVARGHEFQNVKGFSGIPVLGHRYTVTSSNAPHSPEVLKSGGLTKNKSALKSCPSWVYATELESVGIPRTSPEYAEILEWLRVNVDQKKYRSEFGFTPDYVRARTMSEIYGFARMEAERWRTAARLEFGSPEADVRFPRSPVCRFEFGSCPYRMPCEFDDGRFARIGLHTDEPLYLVDKHT